MAATGTDGKAIDEILPFSYQPKARKEISMESGGIQPVNKAKKGPLQGMDKAKHCVYTLQVIGIALQ